MNLDMNQILRSFAVSEADPLGFLPRIQQLSSRRPHSHRRPISSNNSMDKRFKQNIRMFEPINVALESKEYGSGMANAFFPGSAAWFQRGQETRSAVSAVKRSERRASESSIACCQVRAQLLRNEPSKHQLLESQAGTCFAPLTGCGCELPPTWTGPLGIWTFLVSTPAAAKLTTSEANKIIAARW